MGIDAALSALDHRLGSGRVLTEADLLTAYAHDESEADPVMPDAVVRVRSAADVQAVLEVASAHRVPVTARGGGTGRTGGAVPSAGGLVLAFEQMRDILGIEPQDMTVTVQPGVVLGELQRAVQAEGLFYPPDPNSQDSCTLGGNVAENAAGPRTLRYGTTRDYVLGLQVVAADGSLLQTGKRTIKGVTGYDVTSLLVGSEGTLAITTEMTLKLIPEPQAIATMMVLLPDMAAAGRAVGAALGQGILPRCCEMMDGVTLDIMRPQASVPIPPGAGAMLIVELDGDAESLPGQLERCGGAMDDAGAIEILVARHGGERERLWAARRELSHSLRATAPYKLAEDVVVPRSQIGALLDTCRAISERHRVHMPTYGHAGDGNMHVNFLWQDEGERPAVEAATAELFEAVIGLGGTLSGEHGIGILKAPYLGLEQSPQLIALQERIKDLFDPAGILNPGKIFPAAHARFHGSC